MGAPKIGPEVLAAEADQVAVWEPTRRTGQVIKVQFAGRAAPVAEATTSTLLKGLLRGAGVVASVITLPSDQSERNRWKPYVESPKPDPVCRVVDGHVVDDPSPADNLEFLTKPDQNISPLAHLLLTARVPLAADDGYRPMSKADVELTNKLLRLNQLKAVRNNGQGNSADDAEIAALEMQIVSLSRPVSPTASGVANPMASTGSSRGGSVGPMAASAAESGDASQLPDGYNWIPEGEFVADPHNGEKVGAFGMKKTPITNGEWEDGALETNRFVALDHDWNTGATRLKGQGPTIDEALQGPFSSEPSTDFDQGGVMIYGPLVLVKMVDNPSAIFNEPGRVFSDPMQPVVGVSWFHAQAWTLFETLRGGGQFLYGLPDDLQYEYVTSDRGTKDMGTETGTLYGADRRKLAHIDEYNNGRGTTVAVDDPRYVQALPFGVQTTGNVWRWIAFNRAFRQPGDYFWGPYGLRGGSWGSRPDYGRAVIRGRLHPYDRGSYAGFSPVVVRQGSPPKAGK